MNSSDGQKRFSNLLDVKSKHSQYQELYGDLSQLLGLNSPQGKRESLRWDYMHNQVNFCDKDVIDIGANTGYFSFAAIDSGSTHVTAYEGNKIHADFLVEAASLLNISEKLRIENIYFTGSASRKVPYDISFYLNVLHHQGDDYGDANTEMYQAKKAMKTSLRGFAQFTKLCWFQIGYNWKGDINLPLFDNGMKTEVINFVESACKDFWVIEKIAIFDPEALSYQDCKTKLLARFDSCGEFLNRPLFLLRSRLV